jgi:2-dehydro-3-deoxygalactonokinase
MDQTAGALIAVDWGTSRLRARLVDPAGRVLAEAESSEGIAKVTAGGHEAAFDRVTSGWPKVPAIMAGMIGSRQGWREAAYLPCPAAIDGLAREVVRFQAGNGRPVAIVPGVMLRSQARDGDVMRGEETQIAGLIGREPDFEGTVVLPGTHSKWASVSRRAIDDFQTYLSGEMFDLLAHQSFLRYSVSGEVLAASPDFALGVRRTAVEGLPFLSAIFSVRARALLDGAPADANISYLSGLVIGGEIAAAKASGRLAKGTLRIVGGKGLGETYSRALAIADIDATVLDGDALALSGLLQVAGAIGFIPVKARSVA